MARTVNQEEFTAKRNEILDTALHLVYSKGYERMTIQDILSQLRMSSGAFYHYFDSKPAVLEAVIERMQEHTENPLLPILHDPHLNAIEKFQGFFATIDRLRSSHQAVVIDLLHVWYADHNAIVRQKVDEAILKQRAPLLNEIIRQGIEESSFTTIYPDQAGEVILYLLQGMATTHAKLLLSIQQEQDELPCVEDIVTTHAAYMDAIERVLGAPSNSLDRTDALAVRMWVAALRGGK